MSVYDNVAFGLRMKPKKLRPSESEIRKKVMDLLKLVQLDWLADRYPSQLSGGQRQRIALTRALAVEPRVLLLDEPFGALDAKVRKELRRWLRQLHDELHITSIFVTHDQEEALEVADRVVLMNQGHVEQLGTPDEVYNQPATSFVYGFLGNVNLFHGRIHGDALHTGDAVLPVPGHELNHGDEAVGFVRPHDLEIIPDDGTETTGIPATVKRLLAFGANVRVELTGRDGKPYEVEAGTGPHQRPLRTRSGENRHGADGHPLEDEAGPAVAALHHLPGGSGVTDIPPYPASPRFHGRLWSRKCTPRAMPDVTSPPW